MLGEHLGQPADQPAGGLVAGAGHHLGVVQHFLAGQFAGDAVLVGELDVEQCGHQVVGGIVGPPLDIVGVDTAVGDGVGPGHLHRRTGFGSQVGVIGIAHRDLFGFRDSQ